jgi:hypothetical protein
MRAGLSCTIDRKLLGVRFDPEEPPGDASETDYYIDEAD